ncbi:MAG: hypothetical protein Q7S65_01955 [Nanoarchaeota archaeon]|nr:hypothetical protein [Nanoarchaeota archaeon]
MNKRAMVFIFLLSIFAVTVFMSGIYTKLIQQRADFKEPIGALEFALLDARDDAESALFSIDQAARYATLQSLFELSQQGGRMDAPCGKLAGISLWASKDKLCVPTQDMLFTALSTSLSPKLEASLKTLGAPTNSYHYYFEQDGENLRVAGTALRELELPLVLGKKIGTYHIRPSFDVKVAFGVGMYGEIATAFWGPGELLDTIVECERSSSLSSCVQRSLFSFNANHALQITEDCDGLDSVEDRTYIFCASKPGSFWLPSGQTLKKQQPSVRFALFLSDAMPSSLAAEAVPAPGFDSGALVSWTSAESDVQSYTLYLAPSDISRRQASTLSAPAQRFTLASAVEKTYPTSCVFSSLGTPCLALTPGTLYRDGSRFFALLPMSGETWVGVSATDTSGKESMLGTAARLVAEDRLAPGSVTQLGVSGGKVTFVPPSTQVDGSSLSGALTYAYFLKRDTCEGIADVHSGELDSTYRTDALGIEATLQAQPGTYCVGVLALDGKGNPVEEQGGKLVVREEYGQIFPQLLVTAVVQS